MTSNVGGIHLPESLYGPCTPVTKSQSFQFMGGRENDEGLWEIPLFFLPH